LLQAGDKADTPGTNIGDKTGEVASEGVAKSVPSKVSLPSVPTETVRYADYDFSSKVAYTQYEGQQFTQTSWWQQSLATMPVR
jgi:hypothetical protein